MGSRLRQLARVSAGPLVDEMTARSIYAAFAVILPVALGLGLVYLASVGRIDPSVAVLTALAVAAVLAAVVSGGSRREGEEEN